ncbi:serine hydrolase domain-containing protein [Saccharomonospora sp. NPDC046836]|uniref:serine hydrolase domain-containing protein n=1 Tax=Saccharomonospora sp. NPDC046836 TaxID=3156921 RepID=UPI0033ED696C
MIRVACGLAVVALLLGAAAPAAVAAPAMDDRARIDTLVAETMRGSAVPGLALAVVHHDTVVHLRGYGDAGDGRPVTARTRFLAASLSKSLTATAVLRLVDDGAVALDAPVRRYLPEFTTAAPAAADRITVRHLLNQTSGLADTGFPEMTLPQPDSIAQRVTSLRDAEPVSSPGSQFHYFNPNYAVLARIVEVVSGRPFAEALDSQVLTPLGMRDSTSVVTTAELPSRAPGLARGHVVAVGTAITHDEPAGYLAGSGGVVTTAGDLGRFLQMQLSGGTLDGVRVVSAGAVTTMHTPPPSVPGGYAMGWFAHQGLLEHNGVLTGFYAEQALLPSADLGVAVLANSYHSLTGVQGLARRIANVLTGTDPGGGIPLRVLSYTFLGLSVLTVALRSWRLARTRRWATRHQGRPTWWRIAPWTLWVLWMLAPAALLAALPALTATFTGRVFSFSQLFWAMPDILGWLGVAAVTGAVLVIARGSALLRAGVSRSWPRRPA